MTELDQLGGERGLSVQDFDDVTDFCVLRCLLDKLDNDADKKLSAKRHKHTASRAYAFPEIGGDRIGKNRSQRDWECDIAKGGAHSSWVVYQELGELEAGRATSRRTSVLMLCRQSLAMTDSLVCVLTVRRRDKPASACLR
jgi:hypothetical protein